ncbi:hypothetical protein [Dolichospermum sp. LEGE 00246]|uniref:hypothetical protein n=1 Tax=Dolichospermum sp. LEGE 00246 TaxID=1828605 RepID=UPI00188158A5|nr:hypothetical protein [Dolichospermum sp. LEGE 00246]MBE9256589.1 hypothetical protein [Dolichospermum sp. LEGE 00246]
MTHQVDSENNLSGASIFSKLEQCVKDGRKGECSLRAQRAGGGYRKIEEISKKVR